VKICSKKVFIIKRENRQNKNAVFLKDFLEGLPKQLLAWINPSY